MRTDLYQRLFQGGFSRRHWVIFRAYLPAVPMTMAGWIAGIAVEWRQEKCRKETLSAHFYN